MKFSEIKTMKDLESAQRSVRRRIDLKGENVRTSLYDVKEAYTPSNLLFSGLRSVSSFLPVDSILLSLISGLKRKLRNQ